MTPSPPSIGRQWVFRSMAFSFSAAGPRRIAPTACRRGPGLLPLGATLLTGWPAGNPTTEGASGTAYPNGGKDAQEPRQLGQMTG